MNTAFVRRSLRISISDKQAMPAFSSNPALHARFIKPPIYHNGSRCRSVIGVDAQDDHVRGLRLEAASNLPPPTSPLHRLYTFLSRLSHFPRNVIQNEIKINLKSSQKD